MERPAIRPIKVADRERLQAFYAGLSEDSLRARFMCCTHSLENGLATDLCAADGVGEFGFVACTRAGRIVGHVSLTRICRGQMEIGIAVADEWQGRGIGRELLVAAIVWAENNNVGKVVASVFSDNWRVLRLLRHSGHAASVRDIGGGVSAITIVVGGRQELNRAA
jgi:RimJ/RimL family protein N-acetyltransferase